MRIPRTFLVFTLGLALLLASAGRAMADTTLTASPTARVEDDDLRMRFSGTWSSNWHTPSSGQTNRNSRTAGAWATASFDGTGCALVVRTGPNCGKAGIYLDGAFIRDIDLYSSTVRSAVSVWATSSVPPGLHTLKVVVRGTKRAAATDRWVVIDAVDLLGSPGNPVAPRLLVNNGSSYLLKRGVWSTSTRAGAFGGTSWRTSSTGATVTMRFRGTSAAWIGRKDPASGKADVYLDGKKVATVGQYARSASERRVVWAASGLAYGDHTLTVRAAGARVVSAGGVTVDADAFSYNGTLLKAYPPTPFSYPWKTYIVIDKSSFRLYWVKNGSLIKTYPVAHGKPYSPTPSRIWRIDAKYYTSPTSVYGPRKMRLFKRVTTSSGYRYEYTAYAIHGTNEPWVIGTQASHGCIRMYNRDVLELFPQVPLGTMVVTRD